jgi:large subunit ribosomal protein L17
MKHKRGFNPLERMAAHRKALHRNMVTSLFKQERIRTTKAKAQAVRRTAEKMITRAKEDTVHNRRIVSSRLFDEGIVAKLFTNIAPRMKERKGGYTRIIKLGERKGDAAEVVILELVDYKLDTEEIKKKTKKKEAKDEAKGK